MTKNTGANQEAPTLDEQVAALQAFGTAMTEAYIAYGNKVLESFSKIGRSVSEETVA